MASGRCQLGTYSGTAVSPSLGEGKANQMKTMKPVQPQCPAPHTRRSCGPGSGLGCVRTEVHFPRYPRDLSALACSCSKTSGPCTQHSNGFRS